MTHPNAERNQANAAWLEHARFGLFIHWGLYALPARHEWVMKRERIQPGDYRSYFEHFDPDRYDPASWARIARAAGMGYAVITSKHHDGFCLWDSRLTDYKATNTPAGRDLLRPFLEAFRAAGLRVGLYHSLIDWHHPDFPVDGLHPQADDPAFREQERDMARYAAYLHGQVRELLTDYGRLDYLWFDFSYPDRDWGWSRGKGPDDWRSAALEALVYELQPEIVLNDRLGLGRGIRTPEQVLPNAPPAGLWEGCHTMNGSWGYDRDNLHWKSARQLVRILVESVAMGGNMLLNVGPTARGDFDGRSLERLAAVGAWMSRHRRAIVGAGPSSLRPPRDCRYTAREDRLYLHLFSWPYRQLELPDLGGRVCYAQLLHDASEVKREERGDALRLSLPAVPPEVLVPVVELFLVPA